MIRQCCRAGLGVNFKPLDIEEIFEILILKMLNN